MRAGPPPRQSAHATLLPTLVRRIVGQLVTHKFRTAEYSYEPFASRTATTVLDHPLSAGIASSREDAPAVEERLVENSEIF